MKALIAGYYGYENIGDELILSRIIKEIRSRFPNIELSVLSKKPDITKKKFDVNSASRFHLFSVLKKMRESELFILGGGGLIQDKTSFLSLLYYLLLVVSAKGLGCRVFLYAIGVEQVERMGSGVLIKIILGSLVDVLTVRDVQSKEILVKTGIQKDRVHVTGDPVFGLAIPEKYSTPNEQKSRSLFIPRFPCPAIGLGLYENIVESLTKEDSHKVTGLIFQPEFEKPKIKDWNQEIDWAQFDTSISSDLAPLYDLYYSTKWVISVRFHGLVLASLFHLPFIGLGDNQKVGRICQSWGMPFLPWNADSTAIRDAIQCLKIQVMSDSSDHLVNHWRESAFMTINFVESLVEKQYKIP